MAKVKKKKKGKAKANKGSQKSIGRRIAVWLLKTVSALIAFAVIFVGLVYIGLFGRLPAEDELRNIKNHSATAVYASNGSTMIGKFYVQNRLTIDNKNISKHVVNALVATEDSRFFKHNGVDIVSLGRVFIRTVLLGDRRQGGGSSISQQLAKNLYPRKSYFIFTVPVNKIREVFIAARLEKVFEKEDIIGLYLNTVPFGENVYGIEVAANRFFGKPSSALTPPEAATLVGMLAANTAYNPRLHPEKSLQRRNVVLDRMQASGFLDKKEAARYKEAPMKTSYSRIESYFSPAPYFMDQVRFQSERILSEKYGSKYSVDTDGLRIYTTLDAKLQSFATNAVRTHTKYLQKMFDNHWVNRDPWHNRPEIFNTALQQTSRYKALRAKGMSDAECIKEMQKPVATAPFVYGEEKKAAVSPVDSLKKMLRTLHAGFFAVNPANGHVLAWEGGINYRFFQYDHVMAKRQAGSTFKPVVFATAFNMGYSPCEFVSAERKVYSHYNNWSPANSDGQYNGFYSLKGGLIHSVNTIAAEVIQRTGTENVTATARRMQIASNIPSLPSIALGTANISLYEMVTAYTAFANYGRAVKPVLLLRIEDAAGNILYEAEDNTPCEKAFNDETSHLMVHILRDVVEKGTAKSLRSVYGLQADCAGKTGTTQNNADGWFIGFTPNIVAGVWVGAENPDIHFRTLSLGQGAHTALPIFARFMQQVEKSPAHRHIRTAVFPSLPADLQASLECADHVLDDPSDADINFFDRIFKPDADKERKQNQQHRSLINRIRDIFKK